jgi:hypothetical protein
MSGGALEVAKENFREHFAVVGLMERFDETLLLLRRAFGWRDIFYVPQNVSARRPRRDELPPNVLEAVVEANQVDVKLYQYVKTLFDEQVRRQGPSFKMEVWAFRLLNRFLGPRRHSERN